MLRRISGGGGGGGGGTFSVASHAGAGKAALRQPRFVSPAVGGEQKRPGISQDRRRVLREDSLRRRKRLRQALRHAAAEPSLHPCTRQLGRCPDPAVCPFLHVPADKCLNVLRAGFCAGAANGTCPFDHHDMAHATVQRDESVAGMVASDGDATAVAAERAASLHALDALVVDALAAHAGKAGGFSVREIALSLIRAKRGDGRDGGAARLRRSDVSGDAPLVAAPASESFGSFFSAAVAMEAQLSRSALRGREEQADEDDADSAAARLGDAVRAHPLLFVSDARDPDRVRLEPAVAAAATAAALLVQPGQQRVPVAAVYCAVAASAAVPAHKRLGALVWAQSRHEILLASAEENAAPAFLRQVIRTIVGPQQQQAQVCTGKQFVVALTHSLRDLAAALILRCGSGSGAAPPLPVSAQQIQSLLRLGDLGAACISECFRWRDGRDIAVAAPQLVHWRACWANHVATCLLVLHRSHHNSTGPGAFSVMVDDSVLRRAAALEASRWLLPQRSSATTAAASVFVQVGPLVRTTATYLAQLKDQRSPCALVAASTVAALLHYAPDRPLRDQQRTALSSSEQQLPGKVARHSVKLAYRVLADGAAAARLAAAETSETAAEAAALAPHFEKSTASVTAALQTMSVAPHHAAFTQKAVLAVLRGSMRRHNPPARNYSDPYFATTAASFDDAPQLVPGTALFSLLSKSNAALVGQAIADALARGSGGGFDKPTAERPPVALHAGVIKWLRSAAPAAEDGCIFDASGADVEPAAAAALRLLDVRVSARVCVALNLLTAHCARDQAAQRQNQQQPHARDPEVEEGVAMEAEAAAILDLASDLRRAQGAEAQPGAVSGAVPLCLLAAPTGDPWRPFADLLCLWISRCLLRRRGATDVLLATLSRVLLLQHDPAAVAAPVLESLLVLAIVTRPPSLSASRQLDCVVSLCANEDGEFGHSPGAAIEAFVAAQLQHSAAETATDVRSHLCASVPLAVVTLASLRGGSNRDEESAAGLRPRVVRAFAPCLRRVLDVGDADALMAVLADGARREAVRSTLQQCASLGSPMAMPHRERAALLIAAE